MNHSTATRLPGMDRKRAAAGALLGLALAMACQAAFGQALEEIVVTARRQGEEKLMETPLAITAFDANAIESKGISNLQDVANLTPGLTFFNPFGENLPTPIIRGIVPQDIFGENAAAIFIDGIYVAGREGLNVSQLDIERIEVMKGPQTASYGRNAFSGAINYITKAPSDVFESRVEGDVGNRGKQKIVGEVSGPVWGETLTGRVSVLYDEWDGSYDNTLAPENDIGGYRYRSYQGKLRWRPTDTLDVNFGLYRSNDEIDESAVGGLLANCEDRIEQTAANQHDQPFPYLQNWCGKIPKLKYLTPMLDASQFPNGVPVPGSIRRDAMPKNALAVGEDRDLVRSYLNVAWDTDLGTLSALTGYSHMKQSSVSDFNRSSGILPLVYCNTGSPNDPSAPPGCSPPAGAWSRAPMGWINIENGSTVEEWSQEIRFTSPRDQRIRWQVGGYYFHSTTESRPGDPVGTSPLPFAFSELGPGGHIGLGPFAEGLAIGSYIFGATLAPGSGIDPLARTVADDSEKSWSLFAASDFEITEQWEARAELRYTQDRKRSTAYRYTPCARGAYPTGPQVPGISDQGVSYPLGYADPGCGSDLWDLRTLGPSGYQKLVKDVHGVYTMVNVPGVGSGSMRFDNWTGRAGLKYKFDSGWMAYGSVAYGEKPGGLQILATDALIGQVPTPVVVSNSFRPEKLTAFEVGLKGYTPDRRIRIDISAFYNDWRDIVLRQLTETIPGTNTRFTQPRGMNINAGDAHVFGWELATDIGITDNLTARLTGAFTDSKFKKARQDTYSLFPSFYTADPSCAPAEIAVLPDPDATTSANEAQDEKAGQCRAQSGDVSGNWQMRQPRWTASLSFDYKRQLVGDWDLKSSLSGNYVDKIFTANDNQNWIPPHTNVNFSIGAESPRYTVMFWVRNLLDNDKPLSAFRDIYWTNDSDIQAQTPIAGTRAIAASTFDDFPPLRMSISYPSLRTFGLTAKMRFGGAEK
ncbi:MAG: TonB-dependent receptor [Gammaproteobacteria bacterium]|nr:TonB-dependent receptor [Gammaproteobacteria bacterium]